MPETRVQKLAFGIMMAAVMVYGMEVYNTALQSGRLSEAELAIPLHDLLLLSVIVVLLETLVASPVVGRLAPKLVDKKNSRPVVFTLTVSVLTVCCMCPLMSLVATVLFKGSGGDILMKWGTTFGANFPMAFCWQLFIAGPLVRRIFSLLFSKQSALR